MTSLPRPQRLCLAELLADLSLVSDLGMGRPPEAALRTCLLATGLARAMDLPDQTVAEVYYTALLLRVGCTAYAHEAAGAVLVAVGAARRVRRAWPAGLSDREVQVLGLLAAGCSTGEIARRLVIAPKTAGHHVEHIYAKLGVSTRAAAALFAMEHDLLAEPAPAGNRATARCAGPARPAIPVAGNRKEAGHGDGTGQRRAAALRAARQRPAAGAGPRGPGCPTATGSRSLPCWPCRTGCWPTTAAATATASAHPARAASTRTWPTWPPGWRGWRPGRRGRHHRRRRPHPPPHPPRRLRGRGDRLHRQAPGPGRRPRRPLAWPTPGRRSRCRSRSPASSSGPCWPGSGPSGPGR